MLSEGLKDQEIADRLGIRIATVRTHLASVFLKLEIKDRLRLVIYSYRHGLAQSPLPAVSGPGIFGSPEKEGFDERRVRKEQRAKLYVAHRISA